MQQQRTMVIAERRYEADDVISLRLECAGGSALPDWSPGAHIDLGFGEGDGYERQYSLCSDPDVADSWRIGVRLEAEGKGGSAWLHRYARAGRTLKVGAPRNHFPLLPATRYRFIAGGIGITPLLPMLRAVQRSGADWTLLYRGRDRDRMAFLDELADYGDRVRVSAGNEVGVCRLSEELAEFGDGEAVYACGPATMLAQLELEARDLPDGALHVEHFRPTETDTSDDIAFDVEFVESGITATVPPGSSVFDIAQANGIRVLSSCQEGTCGTCETTILSGEVEHRDMVLTPAEQAAQRCMMICVSRATKASTLLRLEL